MINNNWEREWEKQYGESLFQHINCECGSCCSYTNNLDVKSFIQSLLNTKDKEIQEKLEEQRKIIIETINSIEHSNFMLASNDNRRSADEMRQKIINTINNT